MRLKLYLRRWASTAIPKLSGTEHLGEKEASKDIEAALNQVLQNGDVKTRDMGGKHSTAEMGDAVKKALLSP